MTAEDRQPKRDRTPPAVTPRPTGASWPGPWASGWAALASPAAAERPPVADESLEDDGG